MCTSDLVSALHWNAACLWNNSLPTMIQSSNFRMSISCSPLVHTLCPRLHLARKADTLCTLTSVRRKCKHWHVGKYRQKKQMQESVNLLLANSTFNRLPHLGSMVFAHNNTQEPVVIKHNGRIIWFRDNEGLQKKKKREPESRCLAMCLVQTSTREIHFQADFFHSYVRTGKNEVSLEEKQPCTLCMSGMRQSEAA